jgi:hypothetical protein
MRLTNSPDPGKKTGYNFYPSPPKSGEPGSGRGKNKSKKATDAGRTRYMIVMAAQLVMGCAQERGKQEEEDLFRAFLAAKMRSVPKANKTAAQMAILSALDELIM